MDICLFSLHEFLEDRNVSIYCLFIIHLASTTWEFFRKMKLSECILYVNYFYFRPQIPEKVQEADDAQNQMGGTQQ